MLLKACQAGLVAHMALAGTLSVRIQDQDLKPVGARVYLTDSQGQAFFPENSIRYDRPGERHFVPRAGRFEIGLPPGRYTLAIERGKETVPFTESIALPADARVDRAIQLRRWIDMRRRGWYSADMHVHRALSELPDLLEAEDLTTAVPITRWRTTRPAVNEDPDLASFLARADTGGVFHSGPGRFFPVLNEELESRGSALLASWLGRGDLQPAYPLDRFGHAVQRAGGLSDSEKATALELPALAATGAVNLIGLANNHLWRTTTNLGPWGAWPSRMLQAYPQTCRGYVQAGFDLFAALLNAGIPVQVSAGSASGVHPVPPGWSRVYVHPEGPLTPASFREALRAGHSFVTTGPMLLLTVDQRRPAIRVEALSLVPIQSVEVLVNGVVHQVPLLPSGAQNSYTGGLTYEWKRSSWVAARWIGERGATCDAAHTSPIYVTKGSLPPPPDHAAAAALLHLTEQLIADLESGADLHGFIVLETPELRRETLERFRQAREFYRKAAN